LNPTHLSLHISHVRIITEPSREDETTPLGNGSRKAICAAEKPTPRRRHPVHGSPDPAEGNFLVHAVSKFNPDRGTCFVTYAAYWIAPICQLRHSPGAWLASAPAPLPCCSSVATGPIANLVGDSEEAQKMLAERFGESQEKIMSLATSRGSRCVARRTHF
jgi:hypothetical protein